MNVQCSLIRELMLYEFKPGNNTMEATKNVCCVKDESAVDHSSVTRWLRNLNLVERTSARPKTMDSVVEFQAIEANPPSSTW